MKYVTLEREYWEVVGDNDRLIKYNNLSKYRVNRNRAKEQINHTPIGKTGENKRWVENKENTKNSMNQPSIIDDRIN